MRSLVRRGHTLGLAFLVLAAHLLSGREVGPALKTRTVNGQTVFHIGERIPLKLTFSSPNDTEYAIAPCCNDGTNRGGEFDFERVDVSPSTGWSDPLATYLAQGRPRFGHGWSWPPLLKSKPVEVSINLNEYVRFDQPGVYQVRIISHRVNRRGRLGLQSNMIELHIVPATPGWQVEQLTAILAKPESDTGANADLRYLATPAAIDEMTSRLRAGYAYPASESSMGLAGLPDSMRDVAIESMNHRIDEPDFPISSLFFTTMSLLHVTPESNAERIRQQRQIFEPMLWRTVFSSIAKKEPAPRAETVQTLLRRGELNPPELKTQMATLLSASFSNLDDRNQLEDLWQHWDLLRSPSILPALQTIAMRPTANYGLPGRNASEELKSAAFKRWYELDPAGARAEILAQIGSSTPTLSSRSLAFLPPEAFPQFEFLWAEAFAQTKDQLREDTLGSLLVHFGTGAARAQMIAKLREPPRPYSCMPHCLALAYLVRFSPEDARPLLQHENAAHETECSISLFRWISEGATAPVLNEAALEALDDADSNVVLDALQYLKSYGMKSDQKLLWDHYVKWTRTWFPQADVLDRPRSDPHPYEEIRIGEQLGEALIANQGWFADRHLISGVLRRCVGKEMCKELNDVVRSAAPPYEVLLPDTTNPLGIRVVQSYNVAQYSPMSRDLLEAKITQYPPGTKFVLRRAWPVTEDQRKLEDEVQAIFENNGMSLEMPTS